jgi:putative ABC transport system ATP-binding protein
MIACSNLHKRFTSRNRQVTSQWRLDELAIAKGERVLISGPSGCGKTTLLNLVAGLLRPDSGSLTVAGVRVDQLNTSHADVFRGRHVGLIFQSFQLLTPLTVTDNVLLGARYGRRWSSHDAHARATSLLDHVGLATARHQHPAELSLGEQQRVAIARALVNEPPLLLADEPTASLDAANAAKVLDLLFDLCAEHGTTLVAISHDRSIAPRFQRTIDASGWMTATREEVAANV